MILLVKKKIETSLFKLSRQALRNPAKPAEKIFEPLQTYLIKKKFKRDFKAAPAFYTDNESYSNEVKSYWKKNLGIYINPVWHHVISSFTHNYDPRYITHDIWWRYFHKKFNAPEYHNPLIADKNFLDFYIDKQYLPKTVFKVVKGRFFNENNKLISKERAKEILFSDEDDKFGKPSKLFQGKKACKLIIDKDRIFVQKKSITFDQFTQKMGDDFIVQYSVEQHPDIAKVHPNSLNTFRIFTLRLGTEIHFINGAIKFGADNNDADNTGNGVLCGVNRENYSLSRIAYNRELETFTKHMNTGIEFGAFGKIPHYQNIIDLCKDLHRNLFYHDFAAWDVAIAKNGNPVIVELNSKPSVFMWQIRFGEPFFRELTDEVLDYVFKK